MKYKALTEAITAALIVLFVYAALSKLLAYPVFVAQLHTHPMLKSFAGFLAWAVPVVELAVAILLIVPHTRFLGFIGSLILMSVFTLYISGMLAFDSHLPCSCGGIISSLGWGQHLVFNLVFMGLAITGIILNKRTVHHKAAFSL